MRLEGSLLAHASSLLAGKESCFMATGGTSADALSCAARPESRPQASDRDNTRRPREAFISVCCLTRIRLTSINHLALHPSQPNVSFQAHRNVLGWSA